MTTSERAIRHRDLIHPRSGDVRGWPIGIARRCIGEHFGERSVPVESVPEETALGEIVIALAVCCRLTLGRFRYPAARLLGERPANEAPSGSRMLARLGFSAFHR